jgi:signal transduction histidine kinase
MTDTSIQSNSASGGDSGAGDSWNRLRAIIESLADGIVIVDSRGFIRFANPAAARLFNRTTDGLIGTELGTPLVAGETTEMELVRRGGGDVVYAELRVVNTEWEGEQVELVSLRDITDRKLGEERTRQLAHEREARLQAESASRTKSDFLAIMSHELRTPLNAILGYSELIELGISGEVSETMRDQVGRIRMSAKHLLSLVNDILDLAKVEAGRLRIASAPANVSEAVTSAITLIHPQASAKNLALVVMPEMDQLPPFMGDAERVRQILVNLLSNAVKSTEPGGTITVEGAVATSPTSAVQLQPGKPHVCITVKDTGSGIPSEKMSAIFEPFVQAETGKRRAREGSGLGLTIAQRLARAMGGDLTVESMVGEGSSFHLWLVVEASAIATAAEVVVPIDPDSISGSRRKAQRAGAPGVVKGLGTVARAIVMNLDPMVASIVERIRCDPAMRMSAGLRTSQVTDHLSTLLADVASALITVEEVDGEASPLLADAMEIQRLVSERHGAQRARLGWTEAALRREFMIIREEVGRVIRGAVPADGPLRADDALAAANRFIDQAEYIGVRTLEKG